MDYDRKVNAAKKIENKYFRKKNRSDKHKK